MTEVKSEINLNVGSTIERLILPTVIDPLGTPSIHPYSGNFCWDPNGVEIYVGAPNSTHFIPLGLANPVVIMHESTMHASVAVVTTDGWNMTISKDGNIVTGVLETLPGGAGDGFTITTINNSVYLTSNDTIPSEFQPISTKILPLIVIAGSIEVPTAFYSAVCEINSSLQFKIHFLSDTSSRPGSGTIGFPAGSYTTQPFFFSYDTTI